MHGGKAHNHIESDLDSVRWDPCRPPHMINNHVGTAKPFKGKWEFWLIQNKIRWWWEKCKYYATWSAPYSVPTEGTTGLL
jgi:hypothetical protein